MSKHRRDVIEAARARVEMFLTDGRVLDLTGLSVDEVFARLADAQVTRAMIRETRHYVGALPSTTYRARSRVLHYLAEWLIEERATTEPFTARWQTLAEVTTRLRALLEVELGAGAGDEV